jgi:phosphatidylserine/phosphatidylglycerophosphate/cardiolipin synthase-like enzyme
MENTGVKGRIVDEEGKGIKNLTVRAFDLDPITEDDLLGKETTNETGDFEISYSQNDYRIWVLGSGPDIIVRIYGPGERLLYETPEKSNVQETIYDLEEIKIHKKNIWGWLATNSTLNPETPALHTYGPDIGAPETWTSRNQVTLLTDGAKVFPELNKDVNDAKESINFMNLNFWLDKTLITKFEEYAPGDPFDPINPKIGVAVKGEGIHEVLMRRASPPDPLDIRILVHDVSFVDQIPIISYLLKVIADVNPDTFDEVKNFFEETEVGVRSLSSFFSFMHAKAVIIDDETAYVMGSTISQGYFNDRLHLIHDARHGGSLKHDVSVRVKGPVLEHIQKTFTKLWNAADTSADSLSASWIPILEDPGIGIQVVRTLPGGTIDSLPHGETSALEAYQRAIALAEKFIYIEDQYITAPEIFNSILFRMTSKGGEKLEVIIVLNPEPDVGGYPQRQIERISNLKQKLIKELGEEEVKKRLGVFSLWSTDETKTPFEIMPIYVHSKTAIIDDIWATVGSTNLDGASLNQIDLATIAEGSFEAMGDKSKWFGKILLKTLQFLITPIMIPIIWAFRIDYSRPTQHANPNQDSQPTRSSELNVVICDKEPDKSNPYPKVVELRKEIWNEHLGFASGLPTSPSGLALWNQQAEAKLEAIKNRVNHPALILKWLPEVYSKNYLKALGIELNGLCIRDRDSGATDNKFNLKKGKWGKKRKCL